MPHYKRTPSAGVSCQPKTFFITTGPKQTPPKRIKTDANGRHKKTKTDASGRTPQSLSLMPTTKNFRTRVHMGLNSVPAVRGLPSVPGQPASVDHQLPSVERRPQVDQLPSTVEERLSAAQTHGLSFEKRKSFLKEGPGRNKPTILWLTEQDGCPGGIRKQRTKGPHVFDHPSAPSPHFCDSVHWCGLSATSLSSNSLQLWLEPAPP